MTIPIAVFGLGNPLMTDEGIGILVLQALEARNDIPAEVELVDLGTGGLRILHEAEGRTKLIFVDCAFMGEPAGTIRRFTPDEVRSVKPRMRQSVHESDLMHNLELARRLGRCPDDVVILGIEPERVEPGMQLTPALEGRLEDYVAAVLAEIGAARDA